MTKPTPIGTIVVITRNRAARVADNVERLLHHHDDWRVIVVDDASDDDTVRLLTDRFGSAIHLVRLAARRGPAARNAGVAHAHTPLVAFADDDSWWGDGSLPRAAEIFDSRPEVGLVAATVVVEPDGRIDPIVDTFAASPLGRFAGHRRVLGFLACGAVVRRSAFMEVGGFHPLLEIGGEEEMLALDLRAAGWELVHASDVVAHHRPQSSAGGRERRSSHELYNHLVVRWMRRPAGRAMAATASAAFGSLTDRTRRAGLAEALGALPRAARDRRPVPHRVETEALALTPTMRA